MSQTTGWFLPCQDPTPSSCPPNTAVWWWETTIAGARGGCRAWPRVHQDVSSALELLHTEMNTRCFISTEGICPSSGNTLIPANKSLKKLIICHSVSHAILHCCTLRFLVRHQIIPEQPLMKHIIPTAELSLAGRVL